MRVTFFSNYLNHHQLPFCLAMDKLTNGKFTFVATRAVSQGRLQMGYHDMDKQYPFVLTTYDSLEQEELAKKLALQSDVVITGSAPELYTKMRIMEGKLTFRYSERIYKSGVWRVLSPRGLRAMMINHWKYRNEPLYMLGASAYTSFDFSLTRSYLNKTFKWGYFPEVKEYNTDELLEKKRKNEKISLLWAGRMIDWKHPEVAIKLAEKLKRNGFSFEMNFIGDGEMRPQIESGICKKGLENVVHMLGAMHPEEVREHMEKADIFLFTSDFNEGWGAVLNEAMNSACAVVASHAIGSVPFLVEDGKNGFIYKNGDSDSLYEKVTTLMEQSKLREQFGKAAYQTLVEKWNAEVAAKRFLALSQALLNGESIDLFDEGPCSRAEILKNGWYRKQ